jgi:uracil-DNA glycosylase family 4
MPNSAIKTPDRDCPFCPRLVEFRMASRAAHPDWHNAPVPCFGPISARLLVVGLAPGLRGANRTGRPFTGDYAGHLLYQTLIRFGFASGDYGERPDDGLTLKDCRIVNAVRCVPPENLPKSSEINTCNQFLVAELKGLKHLKTILGLGVVAHQAVLRALGLKQSFAKFRHGATHALPNGLVLVNSFHVSRYNTSTKRLTSEMFRDVVAGIRQRLDQL